MKYYVVKLTERSRDDLEAALKNRIYNGWRDRATEEEIVDGNIAKYELRDLLETPPREGYVPGLDKLGVGGVKSTPR